MTLLATLISDVVSNIEEEEKSKDWADQVEKESKEEGREVRELRHRLAHEPKGSPRSARPCTHGWPRRSHSSPLNQAP